MGKLKKTSVTKDAATLSGSIIRNWARTHFQEDTADNASRQLQYKRLKIGDPAFGTLQETVNVLHSVCLKINGNNLWNNLSGLLSTPHNKHLR